jgi:hypothetical protein
MEAKMKASDSLTTSMIMPHAHDVPDKRISLEDPHHESTVTIRNSSFLDMGLKTVTFRRAECPWNLRFSKAGRGVGIFGLLKLLKSRTTVNRRPSTFRSI